MPLEPCRLYLTSPKDCAPDALGAMLDAVFASCDIAVFMLRGENRNDTALADAAAHLLPVARKHDVAFLIEGAATLARDTGVDGIHLAHGLDDYKEARKLLGADAIIGTGCGRSRHQAMLAAEAGCDYIAFGARSGPPADELDFAGDQAAANWSADLFETPSVLMPECLDDTVDPHCEFLCPPPSFWAFSKTPAELLADLEHRLRTERRAA